MHPRVVAHGNLSIEDERSRGPAGVPVSLHVEVVARDATPAVGRPWLMPRDFGLSPGHVSIGIQIGVSDDLTWIAEVTRDHEF